MTCLWPWLHHLSVFMIRQKPESVCITQDEAGRDGGLSLRLQKRALVGYQHYYIPLRSCCLKNTLWENTVAGLNGELVFPSAWQHDMSFSVTGSVGGRSQRQHFPQWFKHVKTCSGGKGSRGTGEREGLSMAAFRNVHKRLCSCHISLSLSNQIKKCTFSTWWTYMQFTVLSFSRSFQGKPQK